MSQIAVVVEFHVKPQFRRQFEEVIRGHARKTLESEPGCLRFDILVPKRDDGRVLLYELYADEGSFEAHSTTPRLAEVRESYKDMITGRTLTICGVEG